MWTCNDSIIIRYRLLVISIPIYGTMVCINSAGIPIMPIPDFKQLIYKELGEMSNLLFNRYAGPFSDHDVIEHIVTCKVSSVTSVGSDQINSDTTLEILAWPSDRLLKFRERSLERPLFEIGSPKPVEIIKSEPIEPTAAYFRISINRQHGHNISLDPAIYASGELTIITQMHLRDAIMDPITLCDIRDKIYYPLYIKYCSRIRSQDHR